MITSHGRTPAKAPSEDEVVHRTLTLLLASTRAHRWRWAILVTKPAIDLGIDQFA